MFRLVPPSCRYIPGRKTSECHPRHRRPSAKAFASDPPGSPLPRISTAEQAVATAEASRRSLEAKARQSDLDAIRRSAAEANSVIAARAFSWTALLNDVVDQLPPGVRLVAVKPAHTDAETEVAMIVRGRSNADIEQFLTRLEATGRFSHGLVSDGELDDDGTLRVTLSIFYAAPPPGNDAADPRAREGATP